jgi:hypothetical protein
MHTEFWELLKTHSIDFGKVSASCSAIHQPSDVSPLFKTVKSKLKTITKKQADVSNDLVEHHMRSQFDTATHKALKDISSELKTKIIHGCLSIQYALQQCIQPRFIVNGFKDCGQYPLEYERIMSQCYREISNEALGAMKDATDANVEFFLKHGQLTEEQLDSTGIPQFDVNDEGKATPRDKRVLNHQRAVLLSHPDTIDRYTEYVNRGLPLGDTIIQLPQGQERKEMAAAAKLVEKDNRKKASEEKRKLEATRKAQLSKEERDAELAHKRAKVAERKEEEAKALEEAKRKLGVRD